MRLSIYIRKERCALNGIKYVMGFNIKGSITIVASLNEIHAQNVENQLNENSGLQQQKNDPGRS